MNALDPNLSKEQQMAVVRQCSQALGLIVSAAEIEKQKQMVDISAPIMGRGERFYSFYAFFFIKKPSLR